LEQGFFSIGALTYYFHILFSFQHTLQALTHNLIVIYQENPNFRPYGSIIYYQPLGKP